MSLEIYVDAYSGYKSNERPRQFCLDEDIFEIDAVENQWRSPEAEYFKVKTTDGKHYVLRYHEERDQWTLQSDFNGAGLFARASIQLVNVEPITIRDAESRIVGCERCCPEVSGLPFDSIPADVLDKHGAFEFFLAEPARCPNCSGAISEKTLVESQGGIEVEQAVSWR
jgi:hypothetical protein